MVNVQVDSKLNNADFKENIVKYTKSAITRFPSTPLLKQTNQCRGNWKTKFLFLNIGPESTIFIHSKIYNVTSILPIWESK